MAKWFKLQPEQQEDMKELGKVLRFFAKGFVALTVVVGALSYLLCSPPPFSLANFSKTEFDNWDAISLDRYHLTSVYPVGGLPYIYCEFQRPGDLEDRARKVNTGRNKAVLIDWKIGKIVFQGDWDMFSIIGGGLSDSSYDADCKGLYLENEKPRLLFSRNVRVVPDFLKWSGILPDFFFGFMVKLNHELWTADLEGNLTKLKDSSSPYLYSQTSRRSLKQSHALGMSWDLLAEYEIREGKLRKTHRWPEIVHVASIIIQLLDGGYLLNQPGLKCCAFLHREHPQIVKFDYASLLKLLPVIPPHEEINEALIPISTAKTNSLLAYLAIPGYPIFEFKTDKFEQPEIKEKVRFLGFGGDCRPFWAFDENRQIVFIRNRFEQANDTFRWNFSRPEFVCHRISTAQTDRLPQDVIANATSYFTQHILPEPLVFMNAIPLDDAHLLAYQDKTFWSVKWDGTDIQQIFPRSPIVPLTPRRLLYPKPDNYLFPRPSKSIVNPTPIISSKKSEEELNKFRFTPDSTSDIPVR